VAWIAVLVVGYMVLGLRDPDRADSTHLSLVVITAVVLAVVFLLPSGTP
jgi:hypothetical protein